MVDVVMPQMGESIAEGTVIKWMKKVGDTVERDEPLFEISTDKVDAEIPSPAAGTLAEILAEEGKTVAVNSVVARLSVGGEVAASAPAPAPQPQPQPQQPKASIENVQASPASSPASQVQKEAPGLSPKQTPQPTAVPSHDDSDKVPSLEERRLTRSSPLVRKIAKENDVDISQIQGSGMSGRVTKQDILQHLESPRPAQQPQQRPAAAASAPAQARAIPTVSASAPGEPFRIEPMTKMRKMIAEHMVMSKRTSAHVTTVFEVDFSDVDKLRRKHKQSYTERGANLTFLPFIIQAVIGALRQFPILNSSLDGDNIVYKNDINLGIAVALDWGLIVPVLKRADEKNILGLAKSVNDLGERARSKKLNPDDVQGGTFTITNPGVYGSLFGTPVINQPQVAILGVGGIKKRAVVIDTDEGDAIVIRSMAYLALTFDHRIIDGAVADQFMAKVKSILEEGQFML
ncbi:MAG TPA: 2-oxoglutarate dehydrogenase, E2 component, dihydrolipoamide succinyltransferase [Thermoanaerobaculia bacterium]|nr:2-oxoglutarate dehydrogenase, E2 component, dihydrolipoamide succinyltransferase [Thermoanaerobaculia bacterium]